MRLSASIALILCILSTSTSSPATEGIKIEWSQRGAYFCDTACKQVVSIASAIDKNCVLSWELRSINTTIARGEIPLAPKTSTINVAEIAFKTPPLREGLSVQATLVARIADADGKIIGSSEKPLWILHPDPFSLKRQSLSDKTISLFDPKGGTLKVLERHGLTVKEVANADRIDDLAQGILIIGAGMDPAEYRGLIPSVIEAVKKGVNVVWLSPSPGEYPLPCGDPVLRLLTALELRKTEVIKEIDKRLDDAGWTLGEKGLPAGIRLYDTEEKNFARISADSPYSWPWLQARFASGGSLTVCCLPVIERWDANPSPRYLLLHLIEDDFVGRRPQNQ